MSVPSQKPCEFAVGAHSSGMAKRRYISSLLRAVIRHLVAPQPQRRSRLQDSCSRTLSGPPQFNSRSSELGFGAWTAAALELN